MRALELQIHNVRSIHDASIGLKELSLLAGANNSGKSNVIDAVRLFYSDLKWTDERDAPVVAGADSDSWIEIEYEPTADELTQLKDEYRSSAGTFRVRNYLKAGPGPDGKARAGYYAYIDGSLSDTLFYGAKNVGSAKVGRLVYIPAVSKIDEHTKLTGPSSLRDLVATVLTKVVASSPAYANLTKAFKDFEGQIKTQESDDGQSLQELESEITSEISSWDSSFSLGIQSVQPDDILKSLIRPQLIDETHGGEIDQLRFGAGFQRHLVYTLIKLAAKYANPKKVVVEGKKEFSPELTWILFEEPEAFLHPSQEEDLFDSLLALTVDELTQVLLTTHSSRFVSRSLDDLTRLIRVRRDAGTTSAYQLTQVALDSLFDSSLLADGEITPSLLDSSKQNSSAIMAGLKMELWLQPQRAAAFFCRKVVLVEGPTESALYSYLISRKLMTSPGQGIMLLDCMGKYNLHRFMALFSAFGIDHSVLYDGDNGGSRDTEVTKTVTDATTAFTKKVTRLTQDIEAELGVAPLPKNESNRKPQYLLYQLETGTVDEKKLQATIQTLHDLCVA